MRSPVSSVLNVVHPPIYQIWVDSVPWAYIANGLPKYSGNRIIS
ncbi:hypothetical protein Pse7429DRAFT_0878 [Pseudanabaena biceps PCC 7429]|nr:hypothetical protein Pse7429DRAFT_0878 [Pseudanabaena biceps PCC 7429]